MNKSPTRAAAARLDADALSRIDAEIGRRLRECRKAAGLSQTQLGEPIGVSFQQIQKYERGTNRISCSAAVALCAVLEIDPAKLFGGVQAAAAGGDLPRDRARDMTDTPAGNRIAAAFPRVATADRTRLAELAERLADLNVGGWNASARAI
jgi:transcriptional regulator with XRE-family HTH domain